MDKLVTGIIVVYLTAVALIAVVSALLTLEPQPKRSCFVSDLRPDHSVTDRIYCRRQW